MDKAGLNSYILQLYSLVPIPLSIFALCFAFTGMTAPCIVEHNHRKNKQTARSGDEASSHTYNLFKSYTDPISSETPDEFSR